jgi:large subunit ribosomal protein L10
VSNIKVSQKKSEIVTKIVELLKNYDIIAAADLNKVSSGMLQDMRRQLRDNMTMICVKNTLMKISMQKEEKDNIEGFMEAISGSNIFLFTNGNPFKIAMGLEANKVKVFAKAGDIALTDIIISAGNTGLSPGPLIGKFGVLGIRTRIEAGNIWVTKDSVAAKAGDKISEELTDLLQRMGVKAAEMGLRIKAVYEKGMIIPGETLILDIDNYYTNLKEAINSTLQVAIQASYLTKETTSIILSQAIQVARNVAIKSNYPTKETLKFFITKANFQARKLATKIEAI